MLKDTKRQVYKIILLRHACFCYVCHRSVPFIPTEVEIAKKKNKKGMDEQNWIRLKRIAFG